MKSTKKILLLVLSLVMLIGLFAVCAFAEEADAATVVYPDGSQVSVAVGEEIPGVDGTLCYAPGNTLYKDCTITGATDGTVPEGAAGQTITITGTKVYFTVSVAGGETTYYTDGAKAGSDLYSYMYSEKASADVEIKLYADISGNLTHYRGPNDAWSSLDLNGHELTNTSSLCVVGNLSVYSSQPGGVYRATATTMINTTNWTNNGVAVNGAFQLGEKKGSENLGYGKNLTVYCNQIVNYLGTQPSYIVGGTYIQAEGSTAAYLFNFYREDNTGNSLLQKVCNANFVITNPETAVFHAVTNKTRTIENCTFVCTAGANAPVHVGSFNKTYVGVEFVNCSFVNVIPAYLDWVRMTGMETCFFGTNEQSLFPTANKSVSAKLYLVHGTETKEITVLGKTYVLDGTIVSSTSNALLINFEGLGEEYWAVGSKPVKGSADGAPAIVNVDGVNMYCQGLAFDLSGITQIADGTVTAAGSASAPVGYAVQEPLYFTTLVNGATVYYYGDKEEAEAALLAQLQAGATLKLYADMVTEYAGTLSVGTGDYDLNGFTWTFKITSNTRINYALNTAANVSFHSSVKGGKMILEEDAASNVWGFFYYGGNLYLGEAEQNTTFECRALVNEASYCTAKTGLCILGGTFIQNSRHTEDYFINLDTATRFVDCDNAIFVMNNVKALFKSDKIYNNGKAISLSNNAIISKNPMYLVLNTTDTYGTAQPVFTNSNFYNVYISAPTVKGTLFDSTCNFNLTSVNKQSAGYVAYTGTAVVKNIAGTDYTFTAALVADAGIVNFGFGKVECYKVGLTVAPFVQIVDGIFGYQYAGFTVAAGEQTAQKALVAIAPGYITMDLTLQSNILMNLAISEKLAGATVTFDGKAVSFEELVDGYCLLTKSINPKDATAPALLTVQVGENVHEVNVVSVGNYANRILNNAEYAASQSLIYAMVEYVRVMANDANFLKDAPVPAGYEAQTLVPVAASNQGSLLTGLRFNIAGAIAIEVAGSAEAEGKTVTVKLANGRTVEGVIENGSVVFAGLYVNEFHGDMKIAVEGESYSFSLANYLAALQAAGTVTDAQAAALNALYNYTYYADLYVRQ